MDTIRMLFSLILLTSSYQTAVAGPFDAYYAHQQYEAGNRAAARSAFARIAADNPTDWRALYNLGTLALQDKAYDDALCHFNKVLELQPDNESARERRAVAQSLRDQEEEKKKQPQKQEDQQSDRQPNEQDQTDAKNEQSTQSQDKQDSDKSTASRNTENQNNSQDTSKNESPQQQSSSQDSTVNNSQQGQQEHQRDSSLPHNEPHQESRDQAEQQMQKAAHGEQEPASETAREEAQRAAAARAAYEAATEGDMTGLTKREQQLVEFIEATDEQAQKNLLLQAYKSRGAQHATDKKW